MQSDALEFKDMVLKELMGSRKNIPQLLEGTRMNLPELATTIEQMVTDGLILKTSDGFQVLYTSRAAGLAGKPIST
jgi:hypothetical protein